MFGIQYALPIIILGSTFTRIAVAFRATNEATDSSLKNNHTRAKSKVILGRKGKFGEKGK